MAGIISTIVGAVKPAMDLLSAVAKYRKKKRTEERLASSFENEIRNFVTLFNRISEYGENARHILESAPEEFSVTQMRELLKETADVPLILAEFIKAFIAFAKACSEIVILKGLMDDLKETNLVVYDFILLMKNAYAPDNKVRINGSYFRFFKTYECEIFKRTEPIDIEHIKAIINKTKKNAARLQHYVEKTALIKRDIKRRFVKNFRVLTRACDSIEITETAVIDLRTYIPENLIPLVTLMDEISL